MFILADKIYTKVKLKYNSSMKLSSIPHLVKEWHPTKNGELTPNDITHGSKKKVWWLCSKGHSYERTPNTRTSHDTGCPYCSGNKTLNLDLFK